MTLCSKLQEYLGPKQEALLHKRKELEFVFLQFVAKAEEMILKIPRFKHDSARELATTLSIEAGKIPPHFTEWVDCKHCGIMATEPHGGPRDMKVVACPWCSSHSFDFRQLAKEVRTLRELGR